MKLAKNVVISEYKTEIGHEHRVHNYEDIFKIDNNRIISIVKVRVIQAMIQIEF